MPEDVYDLWQAFAAGEAEGNTIATSTPPSTPPPK